MQTSGAGVRFIQSFEKCCLTPYRDQGDRWSVGYGHLILDSEDFTGGITQDVADSLFVNDLYAKAEKPVNNILFGCDVTQNQFDAIVSLCFNIGEGNLQNSTLIKLFKSGDIDGCADQFPRWDHVDGAVSDGLYARRIAERNIFENAVYNNHLGLSNY